MPETRTSKQLDIEVCCLLGEAINNAVLKAKKKDEILWAAAVLKARRLHRLLSPKRQ